MRLLLGTCMRLLLGAKYAPFGCMYAETDGCMYAEVGCKSMESFGCMSMPFGCMYAATFGCMYAVVGCKSAETFGCMYAVFGSKFHAVGSYSLHAYPTSWAQGPPGAPGPNIQSLELVTKL